ncbi:MAG: hypothetical protein ACHQFW_07870, partial [Chitinophagales bacterium]
GTGEGYLLASGFLYGVGILKSIDGGLTWNPTGLSFNDSLKFASLSIVWDPVETNRVFIATTFGVIFQPMLVITGRLNCPVLQQP